MFGFNSNKSKWQKIANNSNDYHFKEAIINLMIPFDISVKKFIINLDCLENGESYSHEYSSGCTFHCINWVDIPFYNRPLGYDTWFLAAFPDVAYWTQDSRAMNEIKKATEHIPEGDWNYSNGRMTVPVLKILIQAYLNSNVRLTTHPRNFLETSN